MNKKYCLITIYDASGSIIGLRVVLNDSASKSRVNITSANREQYKDDAIMNFGFHNIVDYNESYPGNATFDTSLTIRKFKKCEGAEYAKNPIRISVWNDVKDCLLLLGKELNRRVCHSCSDPYKIGYYSYDSGNCLIQTPTIDELRLVIGFKTAKSNKLWFCSDWEETEDKPK